MVLPFWHKSTGHAMHRGIVSLSLLLLCAGCGDGVYHEHALLVPQNDAEMNRAMAEAKRTLPEFWKVLESPKGASGFALKVEFTDDAGTEFLWLHSIARDEEGKLQGTVNNYPNAVTTVGHSQRIEVPLDKVRDWLYVRDGKIRGNFTVQPLLARLPKEDAGKIRVKHAVARENAYEKRGD